MNTTAAVITADIVNSSGLDKKQLDHLITRLKKILNSDKARFHFYRGDSFQCYIAEPAKAYRTALRLRVAAKEFNSTEQTAGIDLKISIGIGNIDNPVVRINAATGEAFTISGRELDRLANEGRRFLMKSENSSSNIALDTISIFTDYLFNNLTVKQTEVFKHLLNDRTQLKIAGSLKKSQSTINRHVRALGWNEFEHLLGNYNKCISEINHGQ